MKKQTSINHQTPPIANVLLAADFHFLLEIIRKRYPVSVEIKQTECNTMKINHDRLLFKKEHYNYYCLVEVNNGNQDLAITLFERERSDFEKIECDFMEGFSFAPKDKSEIFAIINTLV